ncbi:hypothetical protein GCM10022277_04840 [Litoribacillus peritrichatus]|uniref:Uncharacterized protein n=1 Tax=Litoribacillus peritrichatus TaxID=718191 RepID=A0ABP7M6K0_9GAMM
MLPQPQLSPPGTTAEAEKEAANKPAANKDLFIVIPLTNISMRINLMIHRVSNLDSHPFTLDK